MSPTESRASWNPAFMPNSASDLTQELNTNANSDGPSTTRHIPLLKATSGPDLQSSDEARPGAVEETDPDAIEERPFSQDNNEHPELENLRSALTTSLGSPGGVEMDENPIHDDTESGRHIDSEFANSVPQERGDFPFERPAREFGHASSASFARTVPRDVDWGEDDDVDPEWNLQQTETDPFQFMATSDRTNSFPQVPPLHNPGNSTFDHQLPKSQAEGILAETEGSRDYDYDKTYGGDGMDEPESGARYEEGLPLVDGAETAQGMPEEGRAKTSLFEDQGLEEDGDFFGELANNGGTQQSPRLGRKSTMQVMGATEPQPREQPQLLGLGLHNSDNLQSSLAQVTGGGIAVSRSTVQSQVLAEPGVAVSGHNMNHSNGFHEASAEELAAKWKEALGGDELLDEDELLEDESGGVDPAAFFADDDEGFLEDDETELNNSNFLQPISPPVPTPVIGNDGRAVSFNNLTAGTRSQQVSLNSRYMPPTASQRPVPISNNPYSPSVPLLTDLSMQATNTPLQYSTGFGSAPGPAPASSYAAPQQGRPGATKSQSFADKSKGGYSSPYDLPMEVVKPRKRTSMQQTPRGSSNSVPESAVPPPRSSSMFTQGPPPSQGSASSLSPPMQSSGFDQRPVKSTQLPPAGPPVLKSKSSFFEDLPVTSKPKPTGRYTPQLSPVMGGDRGTFAGAVRPSSSHIPLQGVAPQQSLPVQGLVAPPKASPYSSLHAGQGPPPANTGRYSPAPSRSSSGGSPPPPLGRYATAPPPQNPQLPLQPGPAAPASVPPPPPLPHQPRTSSPLIHFETAHDSHPSNGLVRVAGDTGTLRRESSSFEHAARAPSLPMTQEVDEQAIIDPTFDPSTKLSMQPNQRFPYQALSGQQPVSNSIQPLQPYSPQGSLSPQKRATSSYVPEHRQGRASEPTFLPPPRSHTHSPSKVIYAVRSDASLGEPYQRPVSVHNQNPSRQATEQYPMMSAGAPKPRGRGFSQGMNYIAPTDGREQDPLQRWRGGPIFAWGVGGIVVTSFPKEVPRYGMGQALPMIICSPGEVKVRSLRDIYPLEERLASFPGPLKGKSKKKDTVAWLTAGIDILERENSYLRSLQSLTHEDKRKEERVLLWKILRAMIENDGLLEGNPVVNKAVREVLSPGLDQESSGLASQFINGANLSGISRAPGSTTLPEPVDPAAVDELRKHLLRGEREKAVWEAVDKRLWAHAMLISNTLSRDLYKQVAQEFIQKEVKSIGENTESLAAVYEIFAGNFEESIDELVPPSARAGLQMVSTLGASGPSKSSLEGLDRWRETLGLVLSNRSPDDSQAINALGKLLSGYGRAEAAHICFLFARGYSIFGGVDDPLSNIVLVGSDHLQQLHEFDRELEPVLLSEVYEYGLSLSNTSNISFSAPHLAAYKLQHATILAQSGQRDKALQYCDAIGSSVTSQVRRSPYHHALLISCLDDLSKRLKQSPKDESSSWISKLSTDKVSGSVWAKFNKFVAGEDSDTVSGGAASDGGPEIGPFARIAGNTPTISRSPSHGDIYGSVNDTPLNGSIPHIPSIKPISRYAPSGPYTPSGPQDLSMSTSFGSPPQSSFVQRLSIDREGSNKATFGYSSEAHDSMSRSYADSSPAASYKSSPYIGPSYAVPPPVMGSNDHYAPLDNHGAPQAMEATGNSPSFTGYMPPEVGAYEPPLDEPYASSSNGGYEPPSYEPSSMVDTPEYPEDAKPRKRSFMDDDIDEAMAVDGGKPKTEKSKAEKDKEADEAFRKAAEVDAKKDAQSSPAKKGWGLGGWFGKKEQAADTPQPNKPIRAKLGEESSFYYDPELKRWVNKKSEKGPADMPSATPPPPRAGPPRTASPPGTMPTAGPSRTASGPPMMETTSAPRPIGGKELTPRAVSAYATSPLGNSPNSSGLKLPIPMTRTASNGSAASGPPSRPTTSQSNASSIDDLLGPPLPRKGGAKKPKKGRGYVDVMGEKSGA